MSEERSLYERLGGYDAIYQFAATALKRAMENPVVGHFWDHSTEAMLYEEHINFVDFLASQWGGTARYRGKDMVTAHRGMGVTEEHWNAIFDVLEVCYNEYNMPQELREEVNASIRKFKPAIVGSPSYRSVVLANPDMDITKGMKSVGVIWPPKKGTTSD
jgi:hemoglobin